jgi:hypothetical protein
MKYTDITNLTASTGTYTPCPHHTGWFFIVRFWIFKKKMYWCDLCHKAMTQKKLEENITKP